MAAIDRIQDELDLQGIKPSKMMSDLGFSSGLYSQWKKRSQNPSLSKLESISAYLQVDLNYLRQDELCEKHTEANGFHFDPIEAEKLKNASRERIATKQLSDAELIIEYTNILKALYSRSLAACWYDSRHISFKDYCAMILNQTVNNLCDSISVDKWNHIKNELIKIYGQKPGIEQGTYYHINPSIPVLVQTATKKSPPIITTERDLIDDIGTLTGEEIDELRDYIKFLISKRDNHKK